MRNARLTDESESVVGGSGLADALDGLFESQRQAGLLHRLPNFRVFIADRIIPNSQFGALHFGHAVVEAHVFPNPTSNVNVSMDVSFEKKKNLIKKNLIKFKTTIKCIVRNS